MAKGCFRTIRTARVVLVLLILIFSASATAQPVLVGEFGAPERLRVEGVETYAAKDVCTALLADYDVILAGHPSSPYAEYASTLAARCRDAFRHLGYAHFRVDVRFGKESGDTILTVREGARFRAGELRITGARRIDATELLKLLQREGPLLKDPLQVSDDLEEDDDDGPMEIEGPLWITGKPVSFSTAGNARREAIVTAALAELGFHASKFRCDLSLDEERRRADLAIALIDEGPPALVESVTVRGLEKSPREAVLEEIGWRKGALITLSDLRRMNARLRESGRFITQQVRLQPPVGEQTGFRLEVNVLEFPHVTPLGEPLTHVEKTLLKFHHWASDFERRGDDLVFRGKDEEARLEAILSPRHGALLTYQRRARELGSASAEHTAVFTHRDIGYYVAGMDQHFSIRDSQQQIKLSLNFRLSDSDDRDEQPSKFGFGFGIKDREEGDATVSCDLKFAPSFILARAHIYDAVSRIQDGVLTIESDLEHLQLDADTGQLIKLTIKNVDGKEVGDVTFERGAMQRSLEQLRERFKGSSNAYDPRRPVSSAAQFALNEALLRQIVALRGESIPADEPAIEPDLRRVLVRLIDLDVLHPLDQFASGAMRKDDEDKDEEFTMNWDAALWKDRKIGMAEQYARLLLPFSDVLFERQSWPWTLYRESCLTIAGDARHTGEEVQRLVAAPDSGPICLLVTAELSGIVSPEARRAIATVGLQRLNVADFRNEYSVILNRDFIVGKSVFRFSEIVRELDDRDTAAVGKLLFDDEGEKFARATRPLRQQRNVPLCDIVPVVLDDLWDELLAAKVKAAMESAAE